MIDQLSYEKEIVKVLLESLENGKIEPDTIRFIENSHKIRRVKKR